MPRRAERARPRRSPTKVVPQTRAARRRAAKVRRARATLAGAVVVSALVLVVWFPAGALLHQRAAIAASAAELSRLHQQDQALSDEQQRLESPAEIQRLAREQYQLVSPGERAFEVLPPTTGADGSASYAGDPADQPVISPSAASELPEGSGSGSSHGSGGSVAHASGGTGTSGSSTSGAPGGSGKGEAGASGDGTQAPSSFLGRIVRTLEFWR